MPSSFEPPGRSGRLGVGGGDDSAGEDVAENGGENSSDFGGVSDPEGPSPEGEGALPGVQAGSAAAAPTALPDGYYGGSKQAATSGAIHSEGQRVRQDMSSNNRALVVAMVGLPARGKSFVSRKIESFFKWQCMRTRLFNVGKYRRDGADPAESGRAGFFDSSNAEANAAREYAAGAALSDLLSFLNGGGDVGILDATNSTAARREMIVDRVVAEGRKYRVIFVEVLCDDPEVTETNMKNKVANSPDFAGLSLEEALEDLKTRVRKYEEVYEEVRNDSQSYIKLYNMSSKVLANKIYGSVAKSVLPFLMGIHIGTRPIWLARSAQVPAHGQKDVQLTNRGRLFARQLGAFVSRRLREYFGNAGDKESQLKVLSSTSPKAVQTVLATLETMSSVSYKQNPGLNPLERGRLDGPWWEDQSTDKPPFDEVEKRDPVFYAKWRANRLRARFPGGESYYDVMTRSESCLLDIEMSTRPVLCVSHITCLQVLLSYYQGTPIEEAWDSAIPEHRVFEVTPTLGGGFDVQVIDVSSEVVDAVRSSVASGDGRKSMAGRRKSAQSSMTPTWRTKVNSECEPAAEFGRRSSEKVRKMKTTSSIVIGSDTDEEEEDRSIPRPFTTSSLTRPADPRSPRAAADPRMPSTP